MNISNISTLVSEYYGNHLDSLPFEKQFHFHSRLWLWSGNKLSETWLQQHRTKYIESFPKNTAEHSPSPVKFGTMRDPALKKFPLIDTYVKMLAVCLHAKNIYGEHIPIPPEHISSIEQYYRNLLQSPRELAILSTLGVNLLYMYGILIKKHALTSAALSEHLLRIATEAYDASNHNEIQLQLYLMTHSIIGETQFYKKPIQQLQDTYRQMMQFAEEIIEKNYTLISLDIKFEFLVCNALCQQETSLKEKIYREASTSFSPHGNFLIDNPNIIHKNTKNSTLAASEHRNVLFLMSTMIYNPPHHIIHPSPL